MIVTRAKAEEAAAIFGFDISSGLLDEQQIIAAYRTEARKVHPDAGGTAEAFARVDWAKHVLVAWLQKRDGPKHEELSLKKCPNCDGRGFIQKHMGFKKGARVQCLRCAGTGDAAYEHERASGDSR